MSYLSLPRLTFSGRFQCDVSTVNNDVRHFDNETFESRFQNESAKDWQGVSIENGWWNPGGTGTFRLVDVQVRDARTELSPPAGTSDPAAGLFLTSQIGRTSAKLVDLDPQWQNASAIFGMRVVLTDGTTEFMTGLFEMTPFRDLYFMRVHGQGGDGGASGKFTSVLTEVTWTDAADASPTLRGMRESAANNGDTLAINYMTYGFDGNSSSQTFTFGNIAGTVAPWQRGEARSFVAGRRFAPAGAYKYLSGAAETPAGDKADPDGIDPNIHPPQFATPEGIGFLDAEVVPNTPSTDDAPSARLTLDLGNSLPLKVMDGTMYSLGRITVAVLTTPDVVSADGATVTPGLVQGDAVQFPSGSAEATALPIGNLPYLVPGWLAQTAGVADFTVTGPALELLMDHPLALVGTGLDGVQRILIRETYGGFFVRCDDFQKRMDCLPDAAVATSAALRACQYGQPLADRAIGFQLSRPLANQGGGSPTSAEQPTASIPDIGTPTDCIRFQTTVTTDASGWATVPIYALDPKNPRGYVDGQIYLLEYTLAGVAGLSPMPVFEQICIHARDAFSVDGAPDWDRDLKPFLQQYDNLYPVMGRGLFQLSSAEAAARHARIFYLSFALPIDDPNQMPATRDLSSPKRHAVLDWLAARVPEEMLKDLCHIPPLPEPHDGPLPDPGPVEGEAVHGPGGVSIGQETGGKVTAVAHFLAERAGARG